MSSQFPLNAPLPPVRPEEVDEFAGFEPFAPVAAAAPAAGAPVDEFAGFEPMTATPLPSPASPARAGQPGFWDRATQFVDDLIPDSLAGQPDPGATGIGGAIAANSIPGDPAKMATDARDVQTGAVRSWNNTQQQGAVLGMEAGIISPETAFRSVAKDEADMQGFDYSAETQAAQKAISESDSLLDALGNIIKNPRGAVATFIESGATSAASIAGGVAGGLVGGAAGSVAGPVGAGIGATAGMIAGSGAVSGASEYASSLLESVKEAGYPMTEEGLTRAFQDQTVMAAARDKALKRGVTIGTIDGLSMGIAGRIMKPVQGLVGASRPGLGAGLGAGAEAVTQMGLAGGGEAAAQIVTDGRVSSWGDVALETVLEGPGSAVEVPAAIATARAAGGLQNVDVDPNTNLPQGAAPAADVIGADPTAPTAGQAGLDAVSQALQPPASQAGLAAVQQALAPEPTIETKAGQVGVSAVQEALAQPMDLAELLDDPRPLEEIQAERAEIAKQAELAAAQGQVDQTVAQLDAQAAPQVVEATKAQLGAPVTADNVRDYVSLLDQGMQALGTKDAPVKLDTPEAVNAGAQVTATPTQAQAEAGNYSKRHLKWKGLDIAIETEQGQERSGVDQNGNAWSVPMPAPYGYIKRTTGADGDHIDVYVGPKPQAAQVYIIDQVDAETGKFDEHKVMIGYGSEAEALAAHQAAFSDGRGAQRMGAVSSMSPQQFKQWVKNGNAKKPIAYKGPKKGAPGKRQPKTLLQHLIAIGGINPTQEAHRGELRARDVHNKFVPGWGRLVTKKGVDLDKAREHAIELGYLQQGATVDDLLNLIEGEATGKQRARTATETRDGWAQLDDEQDPAEREYQARSAIADALDDLGFADTDIDGEALNIAAAQVLEGETDLVAAYDAAIQILAEQEPAIAKGKLEADIPFFGDATYENATPDSRPEHGYGEDHPLSGQSDERAQESAVSAPGERSGADSQVQGRDGHPEGQAPEVDPFEAAFAAGQDEADAAGTIPADEYARALELRREFSAIKRKIGNGTATDRERNRVKVVGAQLMEIRASWQDRMGRDEANELFADLTDEARASLEPATETGADNKPQLVIPGAEKVGDGDLAQLKADKPLQAKAPQQAMDEGLFGDGHLQDELFGAQDAPKHKPVWPSEHASQFVRDDAPQRPANLAPEPAEPAQAGPRGLTDLSDAEFKEISDAARYLKDFAYSTDELTASKAAMGRLSQELAKSGRGTLLMKAFNITRDAAHTINNRLDASAARHLRLEDMQDAFGMFPGLQEIIDDATGRAEKPSWAPESRPAEPGTRWDGKKIGTTPWSEVKGLLPEPLIAASIKRLVDPETAKDDGFQSLGAEDKWNVISHDEQQAVLADLRIQKGMREDQAKRDEANREPTVTPIDPKNVPNPVNGKALANDPDNTLVLMACGSAKVETDKAIPLHDLYAGPLWTDLRAKGKALLSNVYVLSGKWGFAHSKMLSKPYEQKISAPKVDGLISRGIMEPQPSPSGKGLGGSPIYSSVSGKTYSQVIIYGSGEYRRGFNAIVAQLQEAGAIAADAPIVATEGSILQQRKQFNEFLRQAQGQEKEQVATKAEPSAKTSTDDGYTFRETPEGQPTVADLVKPGMTIRTSYGTGGKVLSVDGPFTEQLQPDGKVYPPSYTIVLTKNGKKPDGWINELVAVDGRILKLFENNDDEVFLESEAPAADPFDAAFEAGQEEADQATAPTETDLFKKHFGGLRGSEEFRDIVQDYIDGKATFAQTKSALLGVIDELHDLSTPAVKKQAKDNAAKALTALKGDMPAGQAKPTHETSRSEAKAANTYPVSQAQLNQLVNKYLPKGWTASFNADETRVFLHHPRPKGKRGSGGPMSSGTVNQHSEVLATIKALGASIAEQAGGTIPANERPAAPKPINTNPRPNPLAAYPAREKAYVAAMAAEETETGKIRLTRDFIKAKIPELLRAYTGGRLTAAAIVGNSGDPLGNGTFKEYQVGGAIGELLEEGVIVKDGQSYKLNDAPKAQESQAEPFNDRGHHIGQRVQVRNKAGDEIYRGTIEGHNATSGRISVKSDDGNVFPVEPERVHGFHTPTIKTTGGGDPRILYNIEKLDDGGEEDAQTEAKPKRDTRSTKDVAKSAVKNAAGSADAAMSGLSNLFNSKGRPGSGFTWDEDTWKAAKPLFIQAAQKFIAFKNDVAELVKRLVVDMRANFGLTREGMEAMKPYMRRFIEDVQAGTISLEGDTDVPGSSENLERDSGDADAADGLGAGNVPAPGGRDAGRPGARGKADSQAGGRQPEPRSGVSESDAASVGERSDSQVSEQEPGLRDGDSAAGERGRSGDAGEQGFLDNEPGAGTVEETASDAPSLEEKERRQKAAEKIDAKPGIANIRETLPMLLPQQQDDVLKAETRFEKSDGHGMLFTNGTGTGKTWSGAGIVKRFVKRGKKNVLIVAPSQGILEDWAKTLKRLHIDVSVLESTQDKGKGIVLTTYANLGENRHLAERDWDLVVADESQNLMAAQDATETDGLSTLRAITNHPRGINTRARHILRDLDDKITAIRAEQEAADKRRNRSKVEELQLKLEPLLKEYNSKAEPLIAKYKGQERSKVVFLSATPFAYDQTVDYAEGYLFEYGKDPKNYGQYNVPDARGQFFIQHFGYRMRTGRLTKPDAGVNSEIMERQFHETLKAKGSLSGRVLDVDADYERHFALAHDAIGAQIDEALSWLSDVKSGRSQKFGQLHDLVQQRFDYLSRQRLLEAIKAHAAVPMISKDLALGRKIVVFHDFNDGAGFDPFAFNVKPETEYTWKSFTRSESGVATTVEHKTTWGEVLAEFHAANPAVKTMNFSKYTNPIETLTKAFPKALVYNGRIPNKKRSEAKRLFQEDNSGYDIIIVQSAAGEAGISLHDTTGTHQRALHNLGMPVKPTTAIQEEGRIYRTGQISDAIFRYYNTGTNWERWAFARKIAERASTAENLALGNEARTLKQSFIDAFNDADTVEPKTGEGKGGKQRDRALAGAITPFKRALTLYWAQQKNTKRRDQREGNEYYATPEPLGLKMVEWAGVKPGDRVLEPSAGHGAIARFFPDHANRTIIEQSGELLGRAALNVPGAKTVHEMFEDHHVNNKYDVIVMNPPFGVGGKLAAEHVAKAATHLRNGGRIVALVPSGGKADERFEALLDDLFTKGVLKMGEVLLPGVTFERAGTGVNTRVLILEKQTDKENQEQLNEIADAPIDLRNAENIQEFFNRIEPMTTAPRLEPKTEEQEALPEEGEIQAGGYDWNLTKTSWNTRTWFNIQLKKRAERGFMGRLAKIAKLIDRDFAIDGTARRISFEKQENLAKFVDRLNKGALSDDLREETAPPPEAPAGQALTRDSFELQKTMHAKLGIPIWVATNKARVDRSVYDWLVSIAKPHGGWFSSYQGRGAIPGFQFKTEAGREKFLAAATAPKAEASAAPEADRVPDGWGFADAGETPRLDEQTIQEVAEIVGRVANLDEVRLRETIPLKATDGGAAAWNITEDSRASGMYQPMQDQNGNVKPEWDVITIALDSWRDLGLRTAYHESFHRLQSWFLTKTEFQVLEAAAQQLYDLVDADPTRKGQAKDMSAREIQAEAFAIYMHRLDQQQPLTGIPGQVRAIFAKIMRLVREVRQKLTGKGLTWQDVFEDGGKGKTARRQPNARPNYGGSAELSQRPNQVASPPSDPQQGFFTKGQFFERALQTAFSPFGGIDREGRFKPTAYLAQRHKGLLSGAAYGAAIGQLMGGPLGIVPGAVVGGAMGKVMRSRRSFGWADTFLENARRNLIDRHGLDDDYVKRGRQVDLDKRGIMAEGKAIIDHLAENKVGRAEAEVLQAILTGKTVDDEAMQQLAAPIRESLDQLGQEAVLLGLVSQESFERNRGTYLHRVYMKDEDGKGLNKWVNNVMTRRRRRIIGDSLKGRGIFLDVPMERLTAADPEWAEARRGRPFKGEKFHILDYTPGAQADLLGAAEKSRTTRRVFWPADRPIPAKYQGQGWADKGVFEVRNDKNPKKMTLWRDYSETERERMGEIIDSRYTIAKTYMLMSNDLATGRFYKDVAENEAWTSTQPPELPWKNAEEYRRFWNDPEIAYVKVPDTEIPGTGGKKRWGALAGQYVRAEIWRDLNEQAIIEQPSTWRRLMTQWKLNKTARNPVVHLNNVMSNIMFMDLADVRAQDLIAGLQSYTTQDQHYQDAARHGAFGADQMSQEIRDKILKPILDDIRDSESNGVNPFLAKAGIMGKLADGLFRFAQDVDGKMIDVYRMEDEVFRMATYRRRLALGNTPEQAADIAREQFLDYDIRAPLINAMRNSFFPFIAYPYRAIPLLAQAIAERPWKVAKYVALFYALNAMFYWAADDDDEEKERAALRDNEQGKTWLGADRMMRMPWDDAHGLPVFLDVRRWVPAGDVYDLNQSNAAISMPPWLTPGGPIMIGAELALNRQAFTNKDIVSHLTDTPAEKAGKVADYLWKAWMPSAPWVPGSWYWEKISTAIAGGKDSTGQAYSIPQAVLSSVGIKVKSLDIEQARRFKAMDFEREERELKSLMRNNARQRQRNLVSQQEFEKEQANIIAKLHRLASKKADYFKATSE